jgi:hypothetical protein
MFIPDPRFRIRTVSIPDPGSSSKNLSILTPKKAKKWFLSSKNMIRVVHPGSRIPDPDADFLPSRIPDPGSRGQKGTQSRIRIRNTGMYLLYCIKKNKCKKSGIWPPNLKKKHSWFLPIARGTALKKV